MKAGRYSLCGSVSYASMLVRVQTGKHVIFDVLVNQFLKAIHQDGVESHRVIVITTDTADFLGTGMM